MKSTIKLIAIGIIFLCSFFTNGISKNCLSITNYSFYMHSSNDTLNKTITFKVFGNCDMCKSRIEKSLKINECISAVGHDTEKQKAPDKVYNKLHKCCKYDRNTNL